MNKKKIIVLSCSTLVIVILLFAFIIPVSLDITNRPVSDKSEEILIVIEDNTSSLGIGKLLETNGIIRSRYAFLFKVKSGNHSNLNSGTYTLNKNMSIDEIIIKLSEPRLEIKTVTITFPEGYTVEQMAILLEEKKLTTAEAFMEALNDEYDFDFIKEIPDSNYKYALQGFLFPSTYDFFENSTAHDIIYKMLSQFETVYLANTKDYTGVFDIITKASMIEKEAKLDSERPTIAGVIENRIKENMPFQIDATVLYAATDGLYNESDSGYIADKIANLNSPYNTYMYPGLPAGPICNPGLPSIQAALNPSVHSYLYYHTDTSKTDGSHIFTETYSQHLQTIN